MKFLGTCLGALALTATLTTTTLANSPENPFREQNGLIVVQMESLNYQGTGWNFRTNLGGYSGDGFITWNGGANYGNGGAGTITAHIMVTTPGKYNLRTWNRADGGAPDQNNDVWVRSNNGGWIKMYTKGGFKGRWSWDGEFESNHHFFNPALDLHAGLNTVQFSGRSPNFSLDCFHLFLNGAPGAQNLSTPESPRTPPRDTDFSYDFRNGNDNGFKSLKIDGDTFKSVVYSVAAPEGLLMIDTRSTDTIFGTWDFTIPGLELEGGELWEVSFTVTSNATAENVGKVPAYRVRVHDSGFHSNLVFTGESQFDSAPMVPAYPSSAQHQIYFKVPPAAIGNSLTVAFDYLYVPGIGNDPVYCVILQDLTVKKVQ